MFFTRFSALLASCLLSVCVATSTAWCQNEPDDQVQPVVITSLPSVDIAIHQAMQSRSYDEAVAAIDLQLQQADTPAADYLLYLKGVALTQAKKYEEAVAAFQTLEQDHPDSNWISRARFSRANVLVLQRQYIDAGEIYQQEAERLLSRGRKDELAAVYLEFADRYFEGVPAKDPSQEKKPDYKQALTYYTEAVKLGPTIALLQKVEFRIARCQEELGAHAEALKAYQAFLTNYGSPQPDSGTAAPTAMEAEARFNLGAVQLQAGQQAKARKTWQDFLTKWSEQPENRDETIEALLAKAEYRMSHTYGLPAPGSIGDLELAVTAAESFLKKHPQHELAPKAEMEIAQGFSKFGRHTQAVDRLAALIENPAYQDSEQMPGARRMLGQAYLTQRKFDDAITAWKTFLDQHPTDPQWSTVQTWIVNAEFAKADDARANKEYDQARELWQTFLNKYPLDPRAADVLYRFGAMKHAEAAELHQKRVLAAQEKGDSAQSVALNDACTKLFREAIADWRRVVTKYPQHAEASLAAYAIGTTLEDRLGELPAALDAYKKVSGSYGSKAQQRIARLTSPHLQIVTERKFRSDEKPRLKLTTRNLEKVSVKAYRVDMTDYFRKMHLASGVETLDIALIDPDLQFEHAVADYQQYQRIQGDIEIPIAGPGVTAITVASEKLEATTMLVVSDLDIIVKSSRNELFLFAENMRTGKPIAGASILISDGSEVFAEELTGADGVLQKSYDQLKSVNDLRIFAVQEGHVASTVNNLNGLDFAVGLSPRGYLYTDRPAYRAGQLVNVKGIVRWVDGDRFTFKPGEKLKLDIYDARGRQIKTDEVALNGFGTISGNIVLPETAPQGDYRIHLHRPSAGPDDTVGALSFETRFNVTEYKLEPIDVAIELDRDVYFRGEKVTGHIEVKYYYGTPLAGETIQYSFGPGGETITTQTDAAGKIAVELETQRFSESQPLQLNVQYPSRSLSRSHTVYLATRGFEVTVSTEREVYINGETFETLFQVSDPAGKSVQTVLKIEVLEQTNVNGQRGENLVQSHQVATDAESGQAQQTLSVENGGMYIVRATGVDQFGNDVSGQAIVRISGDKDSVRLRILADRYRFHVGDQAKIKLHWREQPALALVTFEGATVLGHQLVNLKQGQNTLNVPMESAFAPNFFLSVAVMQRNRFHAASSEFQVAQKLNIKLKPDQTELVPGEDLKLDIEVTDPQGKPVQAELSLALVQTNLLDAFSDVQGVVDEFFSTGKRRKSVRQSTSCTFHYRPQTRGVSQFLLAEAERLNTLEREVRALARWSESRRGGVAFDVGGETGEPFAGDRLDEDDFAVGSAQPGQSLWVDNNGQAGTATVMGRNQRVRVVPITRYRTEIRDGRKVQVPYTEQVEQSFSVQVPSRGQAGQAGQAQISVPFYVQQSTAVHQPIAGDFAVQQQLQLPNASVGGPGPGNLSGYGTYGTSAQNRTDLKFSLDLSSGQTKGAHVLMSDGAVVFLNNQTASELQTLVTEHGAQLLPSLAHAETGFWSPHVVTDVKGKATVTIPMPDRSTAWRLRSKGVSTETLTGEASVDLITKKDLFGAMKLPLAFTTGDKAEIPVEVHNSLAGARAIEVTLTTKFGGKTTREQAKTIDVQGPGINKVSFPVEIADADRAEFQLLVSSGDDSSDTLTEFVTVRPYGFPVYSTASGTSSQSTLALIKFDDQLNAQKPSLEIMIGADVNRALLDTVIGGNEPVFRCGLPNANPIERSVSDILGGVALLKMVGHARDADTPEAQLLSSKITGAVTHLISAQRDDGGWSWSGRADAATADQYLSSRIMWALSNARKAGFAVAQDRYSQGQTFLKSAFAAAPQGALERQTILLQAMAASDCADFALANRLYRERNRLSISGLTHLALALSAMNHNEMATDLLDLVKIADDNQPGDAQARARVVPWMRSEIELRAMYLLALQAVRPRHADAEKMAKWLLAARVGSRWPVEKANGPTIAALATWHAKTQHENEKYTLVVSVNDEEIETFTVDPTKDGSRRLVVPTELLQADKPQRIEFKLDGRGNFSYSAVLTGFVPADQLAATTKTWQVDRRYEPAQRMLDGHAVPRGFGVVDGSYTSYTNPLTQLPVGDRGEVTLSPRRYVANGSDQQFDYLVLTDPIPAGCTVLDGSVSGTFERYEIQPGQITFYLGDRRHPGDIRYTLIGYVPGEYRAPQSILRSFYDPSQFAISPVKALSVLNAGQVSADAYRLTPDELYHLGEKYFEKAEYEQAHQHLTTLQSTWRLDADKYKNTVYWLFKSSLAMSWHADTVKYFEILKEKFPDVELSFEDILNVAKSYREIGEYERSYLVYRATVEGSFERESQVAGFLDGRGQFMRSIQAMERLLRDYPAESYVAIATYALAQEVYRRAPAAQNDKNLKNANITRVDLINASIQMLDHFVTAWPEDPANDEASFALATALIDLDQYDAAIARSEQYAARYPSSRLLDSFWYMIGYCHFELEHHQQALEMCRQVAEATFPVPETGGSRSADNKWEAVYIMGQIYHSLGDAAEAIDEYTRVSERFADAAEAIKFFSRKEIAMDEVTTIKPAAAKQVTLRFRNIPAAAIKVYRIDLMKFGLMQRNLDRITAINLAGIKPYHEETVPLGDGKDFRDREQKLALPLKDEGAYLVVCRGDNLYASGLVLISPLALLVQEDATSGRVRVSVKDTTDDSFVDDVHVKVIGAVNDDFKSGDTDLRGLFIADDVKGICTAIAVSETNRYAFYRGETPLQSFTTQGEPNAEAAPAEAGAEPQAPGKPSAASGKDVLRGNIFGRNGEFQDIQKGNYDGLLYNKRQGVQSKEAF